jgi:glycine hydroxymethyltransferase
VRIGTAALTTRGMGPEDLREVGAIIAAALLPEATDADLDALRQRSAALGARFPLYPELLAETVSA